MRYLGLDLGSKTLGVAISDVSKTIASVLKTIYFESDDYDSLIEPTRDGYVFKGYYSKKTGGTKLELILDEAGIDNNSVFYAQWEKDVKNPETFDGIGSSIVISIISLLGIISTILYLKKKEISLFK